MTQNIFVDKCMQVEVTLLIQINVFQWKSESTHNIYAHSIFLTVFSTPYILTQCLTTLDTHRKSTQNTESTLGLATASNLQRSGFETSNEEKTCNQQK